MQRSRRGSEQFILRPQMDSPPLPSKSLRQFSGLVAIALVIAVIAPILRGFLRSQGWQRGWQTWGVLAANEPWLDLKVITSAAQTAAEGGNPYEANPRDATNRRFNYPSLWLHLFPAQLTSSQINAIAVVFILAAFGTMLAWNSALGIGGGILIGLFLVSPSLLLAVERANTDLAIFALLAAGLALLSLRSTYSAIGGLLLLLAASVLKLFPAVAIVIVFLSARGALRRSAAITLLVFVGWVACHWTETVASLRNTQIGAVHSYGRETLSFALEVYARAHGQIVDGARLQLFANAAAVLVLVIACLQGLRLAKASGFFVEIARKETGWLVGATIVVLTFLAGSSFSYRLWFLLLSMPWLIDTAKNRDAAGAWARIALGSFGVLLYSSAVWSVRLAWLAQAAAWLLFASLSVLLVASGIALWRSERASKQKTQN